MRFRMLGPLEVRASTGWHGIGAPKCRVLLACLLLHHGRVVPTEFLIDEIWGDDPPRKARGLVSVYVFRLRQMIGDGDASVLTTRAPGFLLRAAQNDLDTEVFTDRADQGTRMLARGDPERATVLLRNALTLWRGPVLADVPRTTSVLAASARLEESRLSALEQRVTAHLALGNVTGLVAELRGLVREHPLRESLWELLMRVLAASGRNAEALDAYAQARTALGEELGAEPGRHLQTLFQNLLNASAPHQRLPVHRANDGPAPGRLR